MTAHWFWPQYTAVSLYVLNVVMTAVLDGEPKTGKYSFATSLVGTAISAWILWCGGFFG